MGRVVETKQTGATRLKAFLADTAGTTAIEYGLIAALIAVALIGSMSALGGSSGGSWGGMANKAGNAMNK